MKVMVTIDDLGLSQAVNNAAGSVISEGQVDCLSLLATGPVLDDAIDLANRSDARISVHLNCIQPPFLTDAEFPDSYFSWFRKGKALSGKVRDEWRMQIEKVLSSGVMITRLDSHQHLHHLPSLRKVILELAREYGIGTVRAGILPDRWRRPSGVFLDRLGRKFVRVAGKQGVGTPKMILGFSCSGNVDRVYLTAMGKKMSGDGIAELVMHPATQPVWSSGQPEELELMCSEWFRDWLESR